MRPTFREMADSKMEALKFSDEMKLRVLVRGRRRRSHAKRFIMAVACLLIMCIGTSAFVYLRPDFTPDRVVSRESTSPVAAAGTYSSENFDITIDKFDQDGMYVSIDFTLTSRAPYDALVIRYLFYDDDMYVQNQLTITETSIEPSFPAFAEQAIYLPAGESLSFSATLALSDWLPGEEALISVRFDFMEPAMEPIPEDNLVLTDSPLLIKLDDVHIDIASAVTQKEDLSITVTQESQQLVVRDWPHDSWIDWTYSISASYVYLPRQLTDDGLTVDEGEKIELSFPLTNQPETLAIMCDENLYSENIADIFTEKYPDINIVRVDPASDAYADIIITNTATAEFTEMMSEAAFIPFAGESDILSAIVDSLYPSISRSIMYPAARRSNTSFTVTPAAIPVAMTAETVFSWNPTAFAQLGLTEDDVPETWVELLQLLAKLPEYTRDSTFVTAFPWEMSSNEVRRTVFDNMIYACAMEMTRNGEVFDPDHHYIQRLMIEFEQIDFDAICLPTGSAANSTGLHLFDLHGVLSPENSEYTRPNQRPMPLALFNNFDPVVNCSMLVAYVNSSCDSYSYAIKYLELLAENWRDDHAENFCADYEPTSDSGITDESLAWYRSYMDHAELTPAPLDAATSKYLYDRYFYSDN